MALFTKFPQMDLAYFATDFSNTGISQTLATVAGDSYTVSFDILTEGFMKSKFKVQFGDNTLTDVVYPTAFGWTTFSFVEAAASNSTNLAFQFRRWTDTFVLDNVQVTAATVATPIPAAVWMVVSALFGVFGFARKKTA